MNGDGGARFYSVGHSTRPIEEFLALLGEHDIEAVVDVRTIPRSRHNPEFGKEVLQETLNSVGLGYIHLAQLGGLRRPLPDSPNTGWRNTSFRGYADYMQTSAFEEGLAALLALGARSRVAIMCAEAVPWRCHRSLIADALLARGIEVVDIIGHNAARPHRMTPFARVDGSRVTYPPSVETASQPGLLA